MADELLGKAVLELVADNARLKKDIAEAKSQASSAGQHFAGIAESIKTAFAGISVAYVFRQVLDATIEAERAQAMLSNAVRATGQAAGWTADQLSSQATALQDLTGIDDEAIKKMQTSLLAFRNVHGVVFREAEKAIIDYSAATGTDLVSAARTIGMALNDPADGLGRLRRAGISLNDEMEKTIKNLAETGRTAEAQTILINELKTSYGGAAIAARDTLGGALVSLKNNFSDLVFEQGNFGIALKQMVKWLDKNLPETVAVASGALAALKLQMQELALGPVLMAKNWLTGKSAIGEFVRAHDAAFAAFAAARAKAKGAMAEAPSPGKPTGAGAPSAGLGSGLSAEMEQMRLMADELETRQAALVAGAQQTALVIQQVWGMSFQTMQGYSGAFINALSSGFQQLFDGIANGTANLKQVVTTMWQTLQQGIFQVLSDIMARHAVMFGLEAVGVQAATAARLTGIQLVQTATIASNAKQAAGSLAVAKTEIAAAAATGSAKATAAHAGIPFAGIGIGIAAGATIFASIMAMMGKLAKGGPAYSGQPYIVGERGPELFVPSVSGSVVPNNELGRGGGPTINQTFNVTGADFGDSYSLRRMMSGMAAEMKAASIEALNLARSSGDLNLSNARRAV
ncbi:MAG: phage tail length tape measure family protein [Elusimicrobiota bacterium]|jgi:hypothetical protein